MNLLEALRLSNASRLALVGAGGKTTALFQLARHYMNMSQPPASVLVTATTHLDSDQLSLADHHFYVDTPKEIFRVSRKLPPGVVLFTSRIIEPKFICNKVAGLDPASLEHLLGLAETRQLPLLIEADGSRRLPIKAPSEHEPALPQFVNTVIVSAGLSCLGKPVSEKWVHRPERFAALIGLNPGDLIVPDAITRLLVHPSGGLKNVPYHARRIVLLNQADTPQLQAQAQSIAPKILTAFHAVIIAALQPPGNNSRVFAVHEPIAGIVLAAGGSSRFGQPKQLLPWRGEPLVRHVANAAMQAGFSPVVVVSGFAGEQIKQALSGMEVTLVHNPEWEGGQSTSIKAGLRSLPPETGSAIFLLADQPRVPASLLRALAETHAGNLAPIVAPQVGGTRGNPVLFDRSTFHDLLALSGDTGGRELFAKYSPTWLPWQNANLMLDIDTPQDYQRLLEMET